MSAEPRAAPARRRASRQGGRGLKPRRPRIAAVLFDAGGTLIRLDFEGMAGIVTALGHPLEGALLRVAEVEGRRRFDATDRTSVTPYFEGMLEGAGVPAALRPRIVESWLQRQRSAGLWARPMEGAVAALRGVRAAGLRAAVISNSDGRAEQHLRECGLLPLVEFVVDSRLVGVEKPDPRIFRIALERLGLPARQAAYVGDLESVDREGARAAGVHFILMDGSGTYGGRGRRRVKDLARLPELLSGWFTLP